MAKREHVIEAIRQNKIPLERAIIVLEQEEKLYRDRNYDKKADELYALKMAVFGRNNIPTAAVHINDKVANEKQKFTVPDPDTELSVEVKTNDKPTVATAIADVTKKEGSIFLYQIAAFKDAGTDISPAVMAYEAKAIDSSGEERELPSWLKFNTKTLTFIGTPPQATADYDLALKVKAGGAESRFNLHVTASDDPTVATAIADAIGREGYDFSYQVAAFKDADTDTNPAVMAYEAKMMNGELEQPLPSWLKFDASTLTFSGVPEKAASDYDLGLKVKAGGAESRFNLHVTVKDEPTVATAIADVTKKEGSIFLYQIAAFKDAGTDISPAVMAYEAKAVDSSGEETELPPWLQFNTKTLTFMGRPPQATADYDLALKVKAGSAESRFNLHVTASDDPTVATAIADATGREGDDFSYQVAAFKDVDTDTNPAVMVYEAKMMNGELEQPLPSWLKFDASTLTFSGVPEKAASDYDLGLKVKAGGAESRFNLHVTVKDEPTVATAIADVTKKEGSIFLYQIAAFKDAGTDISPTVMAYEAKAIDSSGEETELPPWLQFNTKTLTFIGRPPQATADYDLALKVKAGDAESRFNLHVTASDDPTVATAIADATGREGDDFSYQVAAFKDVDTDTNPAVMVYEAKMMNGELEQPLPSWLKFDVSTLTFSGVPEKAASDYDLGLKVKAGGAESRFNLHVTVKDEPTVATAIADVTKKEGSIFLYQIAAFKDAGTDISPTVMAYEAKAIDSSGEETELPSWLQFNTKTLTFIGRPPQATADYDLALKVKAGGAESRFNLHVTASDDPTVATAIADAIGREGDDFNYQVAAFKDVDTDTNPAVMAYEAKMMNGELEQPLPSWLKFDASTLTFSGVPEGATADYDLGLKVKAGGAESRFNLHVTASDELAVLIGDQVLGDTAQP